MWADSHCHLQYEGMSPEAVDEAAAAGVERIVCVGTDAAESARAVDIALSHPQRVWATAGVHPHDAKQGTAGIEELLDRPEVVAVGECGLDYHYDYSPRADQRAVFAAQVTMARERDLALVVHTREAWDDTFAVLVDAGVPPRLIMHCFTGGPAEAQKALDLGAYLSFSGIVTFPTAADVRAAAAIAPLDRVLVETDSPYLAPVPHRGRPNRPAYVPVVGAALARALGVGVEVVEEATWANTEKVFRLA
jgi:TatD DNase family protein